MSLLKYNGYTIPQSLIDEVIKQFGDKCPSVYLIHGDLEESDMASLYHHPKVKAMVSFAKGEGYGRPLLEFSLTKKPIIASNWSGHIDFLHPKNNILLGGNLTQVHPSIANQFLLKESAWFSVNPAEVGEALTNVHKYYSEYLPGARKQGEYNKEKFEISTNVTKVQSNGSSSDVNQSIITQGNVIFDENMENIN